MIWFIIFYLKRFFRSIFEKKNKKIKFPVKKINRKPMKFIFEEKPIDMEFLLQIKPKLKRSSSINDLDKKKMIRQKSI